MERIGTVRSEAMVGRACSKGKREEREREREKEREKVSQTDIKNGSARKVSEKFNRS